MRGFTFAELMLVIAILVMTAGVSGVYYVGTYRKTALKSAARNLLLMGKYARIHAIEEGRSCQLQVDSLQKQFYLLESVSDVAEQADETVLVSNPYCRKTTLKTGIEFEFVQVQSVTRDDEVEWNSGSEIYFYPDGSCDSAVIQLGNGRHSLTAVFSSAYAKIKIYEGTADTIVDGMQVIDLDATD